MRSLVLAAALCLPAFSSLASETPDLECLKATVMPKDMNSWTQKQFNQLYGDIEIGTIPDGFLPGTVVYSDEPTVLDKMEGLKGVVVKRYSPRIWKGKVFYADQGVLWNKIGLRRLVTERFPAHIYYGDSLFDDGGAIMIDYAKGSEIEGYKDIDKIFTSEKYNILDEIRMVRPGLYIGRSTLVAPSTGERKFALNFTLYDAKADINEKSCE